MPKPKRGEIWLVRFPFTDLASTKVRPVLVWAAHGEDIIVVGIFSRLPARPMRPTWVLIEEGHPDFPRTGLKKTSLLKAEKIAVLHVSVFQKRLGRVTKELMNRAESALKKALLLP